MADVTTTFSAPNPGIQAHPAPAVEVAGLVKRYGDIEAVQGIDLSVRHGELFGFLGPNGAGKSTTIKILCTLVTPTGGEARVAGLDVTTHRAAVRRHIGLVFQETTLTTTSPPNKTCASTRPSTACHGGRLRRGSMPFSTLSVSPSGGARSCGRSPAG